MTLFNTILRHRWLLSRCAPRMVDLSMMFVRYLLTDNDRGILGRDVLNSLVLLFNGPEQEWSQQAP